MAYLVARGHSAKLVKPELSEIPRCERCTKVEKPFENKVIFILTFVILDVVKNRSGLTRNEIENMLLEKEKCRNSPLSHNTKD